MALWFVLALMTAAAIFAVLWPLGRGAGGQFAPGGEAAVYRAQLAEIDRDRDTGLIGPADAQAARVEVSRRLLAAIDDMALPAQARLTLRRATAIVALVIVPLGAGALYLKLGSPSLPAMPLASRAVAPDLASVPMQKLVAQVEAHLEKNPNDGRGWEVLAPVLMRLGRLDDGVKAFRNALTHNGETATRRADLGEAIAAAANGVVTADAKIEFERALALDAAEAKSRYFLGVAAMQDGRRDEAVAIWRAMLASAPADAPWREVVEQSLASALGATARLPSEDDVAAAAKLAPEQREAMIRGMVEGLAAKLKQDGSDPKAWLRLMRAYIVLGDRDRAQAAAIEARSVLAASEAGLREVNDGIREFGLQ
jgi:cytochrome c-type biogenesis protein CcmH